MASKRGRVARFGQFEADLADRVLTRKGIRVKLQDKPFQILELLLLRSGEVVNRGELKAALWPGDTFVEFDDGLNTAVKKLRAALEDSSSTSIYLETVPRRGYRFLVPVRWTDPRTPVTDTNTLVAGQNNWSAPAPETQTDSSVGVVLPVPATGDSVAEIGSGRSKGLFGLIAVAIIAVAAFLLRPTGAVPHVTGIRQITHLGNLDLNQDLVSDGTRLYFIVRVGADRLIRYVAVDGGPVFPIERPFPHMDIHDISPSGTEFQVVNLEDNPRTLWRVPLSGNSPRRIGDVLVDDSSWLPDGRMAYTLGSDIFVVQSDGSGPKRLATVQGTPFGLRASPVSKQVMFSLVGNDNRTTLWQVNLDGGDPRPALPDWHGSAKSWVGRWTADGKYFFFSATGDYARNLWAIHSGAEWFQRLPEQPTQLTTGPLSFYQPVPSRDGRSVYAIGEQRSGQLMRYDQKTRQFVAYPGDIHGDHVAFSKDGRWMAYVEYPDGLLFRSRTDGSDRMQLTFPPMRVFAPQWSPDGSRLAFVANPRVGEPLRGYTIPRSGGVLHLIAPKMTDQQSNICWSADSTSITLFRSSEAGDEIGLYSVDLNTGEMSRHPGSTGLYGGLCSPDGKYFGSISRETHDLMLYDAGSNTSRRLAGFADYPYWSKDGRYIYFNSLIRRDAVGEENSAVYRVRIDDGSVERIFSHPGFALTGIWGVWSGMTPDGSLLVLRDTSTRDLYAVDMELP